MVKKQAKKWLIRGNNVVDGASHKLISALNAFKKYRRRKVGKLSKRQMGKGGSRVFRRRQRGGAIGAGLALGLGLPMILQATQGIMNSKVF